MMVLPFILGATLAAGALRARVNIAVETAGTGPAAARYHGLLTHLVVDGEPVAVTPRALGSLPDGGMVTAASRADLSAGRFDRPGPGRRVRPSAVWYSRARKGYRERLWTHDLHHTTATIDRDGLVTFETREGGRPAHECPHLPGQFICEG